MVREWIWGMAAKTKDHLIGLVFEKQYIYEGDLNKVSPTGHLLSPNEFSSTRKRLHIIIEFLAKVVPWKFPNNQAVCNTYSQRAKKKKLIPPLLLHLKLSPIENCLQIKI